MGFAVVTVTAGGLPVVDVASGFGTPVVEAANGMGIAVTKVAAGKAGLPVVFGSADVLPFVITSPSISGSPVVGQTLTLNPGTWGDATNYRNEWCDQNDAVLGTAQTLPLTTPMIGKTLHVDVYAHNDAGETETDTAPVGPVTGPWLVATSVIDIGTATHIDQGFGQYEVDIDDDASVRFNFDLSKLVNGATYEVTLEVLQLFSAAPLQSDWCDDEANGGSITAVGMLTYRAARASYDATYRFVDVDFDSTNNETAIIRAPSIRRVA